MQYADDLNPLPRYLVDYQMLPTGMNAHRRRELSPLLRHLRKFGKQVEKCKQTIRITIRLIYAPSI